MSTAYTRRLEAYLEQLYLMTTTFAELSLLEPAAIADTLLSLMCSFLTRASGALLLREGSGWSAAAIRGDFGALDLEAASALWTSLADERVAQIVPPGRLAGTLAHVPALAGGLASVGIALEGRTIALVVIAAAAQEEPFLDADLSFLTAAAGIGTLAFASASAIGAQKQLARAAELATEKVQREADEKARLLADLDQKLAIIDRQHREIRELSVPILKVWQGVLLLPIIGGMNVQRGSQILTRLLEEVVANRATDVIVDVTGAEGVDATTAGQLLRMLSAVKLLGARCVITGIKPEAARAMSSLEADPASLTALRNLEQGLRRCMQLRRDASGLKPDRR